MASPSNGAAALELAGAGHPVLPLHTPMAGGCSCGSACGNPGKHPRGVYGLKHATTDPARVESWWFVQPEANIGIRTDGLVVVDVDGSTGERSLGMLEDLYGQLPATRTQGTGRGRHLLFAAPAGAAVGNSTRPLGAPDGIDLRAGERGYIVAAPSVHASGSAYRWHDPEQPIAPLPAGWLERLQRPERPAAAPVVRGAGTTSYGLVALRREMATVRSAPEGSRNNALCRGVFKCAQLVAGGELELRELVETARACALASGLGYGETEKTIRSALRAGVQFPRSRRPR